MVARKKTEGEEPKPRVNPATTPEGRENQLISLAVSLAEKQLREGTASSQVITHYLKMGSPREQVERQKLAAEVEIMAAKKEMMESAKRVEQLYGRALEAMRGYAGEDPLPEDPDVY